MYMRTLFVCGRKGDRETIFFFFFTSSSCTAKRITLLHQTITLCAALMKSNDCYQVTTSPGGFQLLSHVALRRNNELEQIEGNFDNKRSSVPCAKINGRRGHLHMAFFRQALFDLWGSWVVSMSKRRTLPL